MITLLKPDDALAMREQAKELASAGNPGEACFTLTWAMISLRAAGEEGEATRTSLLLAWAQGLDGRSWQAARTLERTVARSEFRDLPAWVRARAHLTYARALWDLGDYVQSQVHAEAAYALADEPQDRAWALFFRGQAALSLGENVAADRFFVEAVQLNPVLGVFAFSVRSYLSNLVGDHVAALGQAEVGLAELHDLPLETYDITSRAVGLSALLVERGTAKAFLGHADARDAVLQAQKALAESPDSELDVARTKRALALVLGRAREHNAAIMLLRESMDVFRGRGARPDLELTVSVLRNLQTERRQRKHDDGFT